MRFADLVQLVGDLPAFEPGLLLAGNVDPRYVRRQLSSWVRSGRLYQLRRGVYILALPFRKFNPHPFVIANMMVRASYVSRQSALSYYGLIPEHTAATTSVTTRRPGRWQTPLGFYDYQHVKPELFDGYRVVDVAVGQSAFVATPEKALLDLIYLTAQADTPSYLHELRLQNLEQLNLDAMQELVGKSGSPKLRRSLHVLKQITQTEAREYRSL